MAGKKRKVNSIVTHAVKSGCGPHWRPKPKFPLLNFQELTRQMTIRCMKPSQIVSYSFSSKQAARAVKEARIHVDLMKIYLFGLDTCGETPYCEQGIELKFAGCDRTVLFSFTNDEPISRLRETDKMFYKTVTIDGKELKKCFTEKWNLDNVDYVISCLTLPYQMICHLKEVEKHFRSVFVIEKTDISLSVSEVGEYKRYFEEGPKVVRKLHIFNWEQKYAKRVVAAFQPSYIHFDECCVCCSGLRPIKVVADRISFPRNAGTFHLRLLVAKQIEFYFPRYPFWTFGNFITLWMSDEQMLCRDTLELFKAHVPQSLTREDVFEDLNSEEVNIMAFDRNRRPLSLKHNMNDEFDDAQEEELDLRHAVDITRDDGRIGTIHFGENFDVLGPGYEFKIIWFVVWPKTLFHNCVCEKAF